jgi:hypothetical protein
MVTLMLPAVIMLPATDLDGAVAELSVGPKGVIIADIRIPAPKPEQG